MREQYIQAKITTGRFTLPAAIIIATACWLISYFFIPDVPEREKGYSIFGADIVRVLPIWVNQLISGLLHLMIGYLLIWLNNSFGLIRVRASIQTSVYLLFVAAIPTMHLLYAGNIAAFLMVLSIYTLFDCYQKPNPSGRTFLSFFFLSLGSLVLPQLMFFIPLWWLGLLFFKALTPQSLPASIIGWVTPYWFLFSYAYFTDGMELFYSPFIELSTFYPITPEYLEPWETITLAYCLILFIATLIHVFANGYKDKIRVRFYLYFLLSVAFGIFIIMFLQPAHFTDLLPLLSISTSILVGHMFALSNSKVANLFFVLSSIGLIFLFCINVWMLL